MVERDCLTRSREYKIASSKEESLLKSKLLITQQASYT